MKYPESQELYDSSDLPFNGRLDESLSHLKNRIEMGKASLMIIEGEQGEGKTTLAIHAANYYEGKKIDLKKQYAMGGDEFIEKFMMCNDEDSNVVIYDESGDFASRRAQTSFNHKMNRVFETFRVFNILVILVLPSFKVLDNSLFDKGIPKLLIRCYGRNNKYGNYKAFFPEEMGKIRYYMDRKVPWFKPKAYTMVKPNYYGHFYDLDPDTRRKVHNLSKEGKKDIMTENILRNRGLVTYKEIAEEVGRSVRWVKDKKSDLGVKSERIFKGKKYFDKGVIGQFKEAKKLTSGKGG